MKTVIVAAGILVEGGKVLLTQRKAGAHLEGAWEFPGGKVNDGEHPTDALFRELREEIGIEVVVEDIAEVTYFRYPEADKAVLLLFYWVSRTPWSPEPCVIDVAALRWASASDLDPRQFPPADVDVLIKVARRLNG